MSVAGALVDRPIPMIRCKTVDIMVPADAEIVIKGYLNTEYIEPEGPFGESHGYMHPRQLNPFMDVTAITHRKDAIYTSWLSQLPPGESSVIRKIGYDRLMLVHLRDECRITSVLRVEMHEPLTNTYKLVIIQMRRPNEAEVWRALHAACSFHPGVGKIVVAVDEDIDPSNEAAVFWAMCYRMKPHKDVHIVGGMEKGHAPPFLYHHEQKGTDVVSYHLPADESAMLCNAILKEPFPPVSLPKREYMENAEENLGRVGLAEAQTADALVRILARPMGRRAGSRGRACRPRPPFRNRRKVKSGKGESEVTCYFALTISASEFANVKPETR